MQNNQIIKCLLCDADATLKHESYPGYIEPMIFQIYHCEHCQTAFSIPRISDTKELYETIYKKKDEIPGYSRYWKYAEDIKSQEKPLDYLAEAENIYWSVREALSQINVPKDSANILEIGSGLGYLTFALRKSGYNCYGLDISEAAVNRARLEYGDYYICENLFNIAERELESFDLIIMTEVIEHIEAPINFFKALLRLLKPHGRAIITTPNKSFFPSDIIWFSDCPPVHYWWFSEESMSYIAGQINTNIKFIDFSSYYKEHYTWFDINNLGKNLHPVFVLDKSGEVNKYWEQKQSYPFIENLRKGFSQIPFIKHIFRETRKILNPSIIVCEERGPILCGIFEKQ